MKTIYKKLLFLLLLLPFNILAQSGVEGSVIDKSTKQALPGVNITVQGTTNGTSTDLDGKFNLVNIKKGSKLVFSFIGYKNEIIEFNNQKSLSVSLESESSQLQEVVVQVGYGSVKKKDATGSVTLITTKDFNKGPITNVEGLLSGRSAGVVINSSGTPGNDGDIRIRGGSSLIGGNDPLIVVDGLPLNGKGGLSMINPNDIESLSILKDASATAIYGNRGSNGVILVTTKRGSKKGLQVSLNTFTTYNTLAKQTDVYSADEFRSIINEIDKPRLLANPGATPYASFLGTANTNWQKEIFKNNFTSDVNLSINGNLFNKLPARLTIGNTDNKGILLTSEYKRTTGSVSLNPSFFKDYLKFNITGTYSYTYNRIADEGAIGNAINYDPTKPVYDPTSPFAGYNEWTMLDTASNPNIIVGNGTSNPVSMLREKRDIKDTKRYFGNFNMEYKFHFLPDLKAIVNAGIDNQDWNETIINNANARIGIQSVQYISGYKTEIRDGVPTQVPVISSRNQAIGYNENKWEQTRNKNLNVQLNYTKKIGKLNIDALAGHEYQQFDKTSFYSGNRNLYASYAEVGTKLETVRDTTTDPGNKTEAYFGRLNLGYNDKYLLTVNLRRDGSTRVSPINKWANFGGVAFAWKIKEENFLKDSKLFSDLKLRLSMGENGNQNIPGDIAWFQYYVVSTTNNYQFGNVFIPIAKPVGYNKNLKWERSKKYNAGLDFGFINNRLKGSIDVYYGKTTNLYANTVQGSLQNLSIIGPGNVGALESKGAELGLNFEAIKNDNFDLNLNYNFSYNALKILDLYTDNQDQGGVGLGGFVQTFSIGYSPYAYKVYQQVYDVKGRPIQGVYVDRNHDGLVDSNDKYIYKKPQAPVTMGFMANATIYKNWDFSMAWRASIGNYIYDQVSADRATLGGIVSADGTYIQNVPVDYSNTGFNTPNKESDYYVKNGSFLKLDNVTLGYTFHKIGTKNGSIKAYTGVQNVLTITKYKGMDPEVFNNGIDGVIFPRARMFTLGINANF